MAYPVQAAESGNEGTGTSGVATLPAHASGDLLIVHWSVDGQYTAPTLESGWTQIANQNVSSGTASMTHYSAFKIATSSSETSPTLTWGSSEDWLAFTETVTGHGVTGIGDLIWATGTSTTSNSAMPALTTLNAATEYLIIGTIGGATGNASAGSVTGAWTGRRTDNYNGTTATAQLLMQAEMTWTGGTTPTMGTISLPTAMRNYKLTLAIPAGTAAVTGSGALSGSGTLTGSGVPVIAQGGPLSGSGTLTGSGVPVIARTGNLTGSGTLTATGSVGITGAGNLSGAGTLTGSGVPVIGRSGALSGAGTLSGSGTPSIPRTGALSGAGTLTGSGSPRPSRAGNLTGSGQLTASGTPSVVRTGTLAGSGTLTGEGVVLVASGFTVALKVDGVVTEYRAMTLKKDGGATAILAAYVKRDGELVQLS